MRQPLFDAMFTLRKAQRTDAGAIRRLIWKVHINPTGLDWRHFTVAVDENGQVIATGQIKPHRDGSFELASIATEPDWRGQGVAGTIIKHLINDPGRPHPLFLTCRGELGSFYVRFGFTRAQLSEMPSELRQRSSMMAWVKRNLFHRMPELWIMRID